MAANEGQPVSFIAIFQALGLLRAPTGESAPADTSVEAIKTKITNPQIVQDLGATPTTVSAIRDIELSANLLDSYSETGDLGFIEQAETAYNNGLSYLNQILGV